MIISFITVLAAVLLVVVKLVEKIKDLKSNIEIYKHNSKLDLETKEELQTTINELRAEKNKLIAQAPQINAALAYLFELAETDVYNRPKFTRETAKEIQEHLNNCNTLPASIVEYLSYCFDKYIH